MKVTGLGIDAALDGRDRRRSRAADTRGLGELLYAALTGMWPGPDHPVPAAAPLSDGQPRRPRQVRAGRADALDDVASRALALPGRDSQAPFTSPAELAAALARRDPAGAGSAGRWHRRDPRGSPAASPASRRHPAEPAAIERLRPPDRPARQRRQRRRGPGRSQACWCLVAVVGASAAACTCCTSRRPASSPGGKSSPTASSSVRQLAVIKPLSASGFDALNPGDDPTTKTATWPPTSWTTTRPAGVRSSTYGSSNFGNLKAGTGLILDMGQPVRISSVTVTFGSVPGADVELKLGNSDTRSRGQRGVDDDRGQPTTMCQAPRPSPCGSRLPTSTWSCGSPSCRRWPGGEQVHGADLQRHGPRPLLIVHYHRDARPRDGVLRPACGVVVTTAGRRMQRNRTSKAAGRATPCRSRVSQPTWTPHGGARRRRRPIRCRIAAAHVDGDPDAFGELFRGTGTGCGQSRSARSAILRRPPTRSRTP